MLSSFSNKGSGPRSRASSAFPGRRMRRPFRVLRRFSAKARSSLPPEWPPLQDQVSALSTHPARPLSAAADPTESDQAGVRAPGAGLLRQSAPLVTSQPARDRARSMANLRNLLSSTRRIFIRPFAAPRRRASDPFPERSPERTTTLSLVSIVCSAGLH